MTTAAFAFLATTAILCALAINALRNRIER